MGDVFEGFHLPDVLSLVELAGEDRPDGDFGAGVTFDEVIQVWRKRGCRRWNTGGKARCIRRALEQVLVHEMLFEQGLQGWIDDGEDLDAGPVAALDQNHTLADEKLRRIHET